MDVTVTTHLQFSRDFAVNAESPPITSTPLSWWTTGCRDSTCPDRVPLQIAGQVDDVARHVRYTRRSVPNFEHGPTFPVEARDQFTITDACIGCGVCTHVCPCGNYRVIDGRAQASGGCEHCFACVQNCPHNATYLTDGEANRHARYRNRHVTLQDIINANNQL